MAKETQIDKEQNQSQLGQYMEALFADWLSDRKPKEIEWEKNLEAFLAEASDAWKERDKKKQTDGDEWKSDIFVRVTKIKVMIAFALICDMEFQGTGDLPFLLEVLEENYSPDELKPAEDNADQMAKNIKSQMKLAKVAREAKKTLFSMPLYGGGWARDTFEIVKEQGWKRWSPEGYEGVPEMERYEQYSNEYEVPGIEYRSVWDMVTDPESDDFDKSRGYFDRKMVSAFDLRKLMEDETFDSEAIEGVIERNAKITLDTGDTASLTPHLRNVTNRKRGMMYLEYWGRVPRNLIESFEEESDDERENKNLVSTFGYEISDDSGDEVEVKLGMVDSTVICLVENEDGKRPHYYIPFEQVLDYMAGVGVADNLRDCQKVLNGGVNAFADNKALSGNVVMGIIKSMLVPGQKSKIHPGKVFLFEDGTNIREAMQAIDIPDVGESLMSLIYLFERYADESSQIPKIMQGEVAEKKKADTLGEMQMLQQNAGKYMGQVMRNIDDYLVEPLVNRYYDWNMMQGGNEAMGAFKVKALGFSSYQSKVLLAAALTRFLALVGNNEALMAEINTREILEQIGKAMDLDPVQVLLTEEEKMKRAQGQQQAEAEAIETQVETQDKVGDDQLERDLVLEGEKSENKKEEIVVKGAIELDKERIKAAVQKDQAKKAKKEAA